MPDPVLDADPAPEWVPAAYERRAYMAFNKAFVLDEAIAELHVQQHPSNIAESQVQQRKAILEIARQLLIKKRDAYMDRAVELWVKYRSFVPPEPGNE